MDDKSYIIAKCGRCKKVKPIKHYIYLSERVVYQDDNSFRAQPIPREYYRICDECLKSFNKWVGAEGE